MTKKFSRILALGLALIMSFALAATTAFAAEGPKFVGEDDFTIQIDKVLNVDDYAQIGEDLEFTFELTGEAPSSSLFGFDPYAGIDFEDITVTSAYTKYEEDVEYTGSETAGTITVTYHPDDLNPGNTLTAIYKGMLFDFSGIDYPAPGVYRYKLTETAGSEDGVTYSQAEYYIDVYVAVVDEDTGELGIVSVIVTENGVYEWDDSEGGTDPKTREDEDYGDVTDKKDVTPDDPEDDPNSPEYEGDHSGAKFENTLTTPDVDLEKEVTGNQGDRNKAFEFTVTVSNIPDGIDTIYYKDASGQVKTAPVADGTATITELYLKNGQKATILDLPYGVKVEIEEQDATDYDTTIDGATTAEDKTATVDELTTDAAITYTNDKDGLIPTGVLLTIAPFAALMGVGVVGGAVVLKKKKEEDE